MATVLVVDDEPIVRDVVVRYLQRDGFDTLEAGDGDAARRADRDAATPDLVVLDVMLPGHRRARALPLDPQPLRPAR